MKPYNKLTHEKKLACLFLYPEEAKRDKDYRIREEAKLYFNVKNSQDNNK